MNKKGMIYLKVTEIKPYNNNPRYNEHAVDAVAESIKQFGFKQPIVVDKDYFIIVGHTRHKAAIKLGLEEVPVIVADDLDDAKAKAYRLADNKTSELAEWDFTLLEQELSELKDMDFDLDELGFEEIKKEVAEPKTKAKQEPKSQSKLQHTCPMCGYVWTK